MKNKRLIKLIEKIKFSLVQERGGITCHSAIISRELGIPCIVGTKIATKVLKDNDFIEVNANRRVIRILKK